ncbi:metal-binding protein-like protein [Candidatus Magnetomorum sp. HK-1]|nr:metal-binding protein-like protein [Candidatus Magnetomorum sp. HK-1]
MKVFPITPNNAYKNNDLKEFLMKLCQIAIENGALSANKIDVSNIIFNNTPIDCPQDEQSFYYPQVIYKKDPIQKILKTFHWAVVFIIDRKLNLKKVYEVTAKIESNCFYKNYHLAVGLAAGNCRKVFCSTKNSCQAMTKGKGCAFPMIARPSVEACGIDLISLAQESNIPEYIQDDHLLGMVFVD